MAWRRIAPCPSLSELRHTALARHLIHIRWNPNFEPPEGMLEQLLQLDSIGNLVYNDSTPGERQFRLDDQIQRYAARQDVPIEQARAHFENRREAASTINNRAMVKAKVAGRLPLGSHD